MYTPNREKYKLYRRDSDPIILVGDLFLASFDARYTDEAPEKFIVDPFAVANSGGRRRPQKVDLCRLRQIRVHR